VAGPLQAFGLLCLRNARSQRQPGATGHTTLNGSGCSVTSRGACR
jgi:hypothetical protein